MTKKCIYPGSFDPITFGHIDLIKRALKIFSRVIVAVAENSSKETLFAVKERIAMIKKVTANLKGVEVKSFKGLTADYAKSRGCYVIIRGIRMVSDFDYEFQMALTNRRLAPDVETMFLMPSESYSFLSSRLIKEAVLNKADISSFVPKIVEETLKRKLLRRR